MAGGYEEIDHPADIALKVWGYDLVDLLRNATCALLSVWLREGKLEELSRSSPRAKCSEVLECLDEFDLLVRWLNKVLLAPQLELRLPHEVLGLNVQAGGEGDALRAELSYEAFSVLQEDLESLLAREIKSATYGGKLERSPEGRYEALLILDI